MKKRIENVYDMWSTSPGDSGAARKAGAKVHPSQKRKLKTPLPHPGQSYNPHPDDHAGLLSKIAKAEVKYLKKEKHLNKTAGKIKPNSNITISAGEVDSIGNDDDDDSETDNEAFDGYDEKDFEAIAKDRTVKEKRKTRQQRARELRDKKRKIEAKIRKAKRAKSTEFDKLKKIVKQLDEKQKLHEDKMKRKKTRREERFSQNLEYADPIYCLKSQLSKNLRRVNCPIKSIVREQLETFQKRCLVEPTSIQKPQRRYKKKSFEKRSAGDGDVSTNEYGLDENVL